MSARRKAIFALLYFSEGCPIGFLWWALPAWLRTRDIDVSTITGLTALLVLPWAFKFLWAPVIDGCRTVRWGFRAWIVAMQLSMAVTLVPLLFLEPAAELGRLKWFLLAHAVCAATQDVAIDALAVRSVPAGQRGALNGWMQAGMLCGRSLFGGGALYLLTRLGPEWVVGALIACISVTCVLVWMLDEPEPPASAGPRWGELLSDLLDSKSSRFWWAIGFALVSAAAFEGTGALAGPFLVDHDVGEETIAWFFAVPVVLATVGGGLLGGHLSDRMGRRRAVAVFLSVFVGCVLLLALLEWTASGAVTAFGWMTVLTAMYLGVGLFTAASYALFMDSINPRHGGTQFSACMAATNGCESWSAWAGGQLTGRAGYAAAFLGLSVVSLASLALLRRIGSPVSQSNDPPLPRCGRESSNNDNGRVLGP